MFNDTNKQGEPAAPSSVEPKRRNPKVNRPVMVKIGDIVLGSAGRRLDNRKVRQLQCAVSDQGLQNPIQVYRLKQIHKGKYGLAAGQHRLQAMKNLGHTVVPAFILTRRQAKVWRASENLHRKELLPLDRSEDIVSYAEHRLKLPNVKDGSPMMGGKQPHDKGYKKLEAALGIHRKRIAEAFAHHALPEAVKRQVRRLRKCNKLATLNSLVRLRSMDEQLRFIRERFETEPIEARSKKTTRIDRDFLAEGDPNIKSVLQKLNKAWRASGFRARFERETPKVQKAFLRQLLS